MISTTIVKNSPPKSEGQGLGEGKLIHILVPCWMHVALPPRN